MRTVDFHAHPLPEVFRKWLAQLGIDYPHSPAPVILKKKAHFDSNPKYDEIRTKIYSRNAEILLDSEKGYSA